MIVRDLYDFDIREFKVVVIIGSDAMVFFCWNRQKDATRKTPKVQNELGQVHWLQQFDILGTANLHRFDQKM